MVSRPCQLVILTAVVCCYMSLAAGFNLAVIAIDLGSEFTKVALVKPGVPMETVLNDESSRKTASIVAMRDGERHYGQAAVNTGVRFPKKAFWYLMHIVGLKYEDPQVELYRKRFPYYDLIKDETRGTVLFRIEDESIYSPEELIAMQLEKAKVNTEAFADQPIKDCVITVPAFFSQSQRLAIVQAASMVDLNVLQIMSDNAAVALNYGVFRRKMFNSTMQYYMFYDMGATSTTATIVGYQMVKMKEGTRMETNPQLVIKGVGFDRTLGGLEVTLRMRDHLAKAFTKSKKTKTDVYTNPRAMAKLFKEAERVKKVLSANNEHSAQVEGLLDDEDFRVKVTRTELEDMTADMMDRVTKPIEDALKSSQVTLPEITEIIMFGGGTRMPKVQSILTKYLEGRELGKSINADEAAALGAVYQAAHLGKGFKVKTFYIKEGTIYPISVEFARQRSKQDDHGDAKLRTVKRTLFGRMNPFPQKKVMTFSKHTRDFTFNVTYGDLSFLSEEDARSFSTPVLSTYTVTGVDTAYSKHAEDAESKGVKAHFRLDENGILHMDQVEFVFERQGPHEEESTWSKIGSTLGGLFGSSNDKEAKVEESDPGTEGDKSASTSAENEGETTPTGKTDEKQEGDEIADNKKVPAEEEEAGKKEKGEEKEEVKEEKEAEKTEEKTEEKEEKKEEKEEKAEEKTEEKKEEKEEKEEKDTKDQKETVDDKKDGNDKENATKAEDEDKKVNKTTVIKENLTADLSSFYVPQLSTEQFTDCKKKLADLTARDKEKKLLEKSKNDLEAFIFDMSDRLSQTMHEACSTEGERQDYSKALSEASDWMYEQDEDAKKEIYMEKLRELKKMTRDLEMRVYEMKERPEALGALTSMMNHTEYFLKTAKNLSQIEEPIFTEVEITTLEKLINDTHKWQTNMVEEQKLMPDTERPKMLVQDIGMKIQALDREVKYLINKAKNFRPKSKPKVKKNATSSDNDTATNETETTNEKASPDTATDDAADKATDAETPLEDTVSADSPEGTAPAGDTGAELPPPPTEGTPSTGDTEAELPPPPTEGTKEQTEEEDILQIDGEEPTVTTTEKPTTTTTTTESTTKDNKHDGSDL